ncbi:hypothetical protein GLOIN_2v1839461 [Rhizophagus irregularis DAOM 181602=DAOM 197198]|uniref:Uncharacterized protein n=1 Tax=Rhizophagus irregularis (strain DAOM 181602 / DAOM 197198 / MUCL 43194) TaxID=747089 RepID=A0A2P4Q983_RHIID|nr:hypothetical protein GLOIN_2v1839461 [Rhizophagus irregularis DAOM 181602=DAOM 197198]POG74191.1 hypothetical protein GLOIN_2v1839461 [Rhizophagus irregularis DAOM 181602=DAOM 197198]|eukprot:XP_025181057.1 hypothetical protein GLOIN_2v1839461 [Rhizophagus irregularis DAOM 181602=DAOM 197198]
MDTSPSCKTGGYINLCTMDLEFDVRKLISDTYFFKRHQTAPPPICRATRDQTNANSGNDTSAQPQSRRNSSRRSSRYVEEFENRARDIRSQDSSVTDLTARSRAYREVAQHPPVYPTCGWWCEGVNII